MAIPVILMTKIGYLLVFMLLGFASVKTKILKYEDSTALSKMLLYIITPAVVLEAYDVVMTTDILKGLLLAFCGAVAAHIALVLLDLAYKKILRPSGTERASAMYSNTGNLLIPIVVATFGEEWVIFSSAYLCVQLFFVWTHAESLFTGQKGFNLKKIATNIVLITIVVGMILAFSGIRLPYPVRQITEPLANMVGPISLFTCGMIATQVKLRKTLCDKRIYIVLLIRMVIAPIIVLPVLKLIAAAAPVPDAEKVLLITYLAAISPIGTTVTQFAQIYNKEADFAVAANIISTVLCVATLPAFVALYLI